MASKLLMAIFSGSYCGRFFVDACTFAPARHPFFFNFPTAVVIKYELQATLGVNMVMR